MVLQKTLPAETRLTAKVFREFAYRWTCPHCSQDNLTADKPALNGRCDICGHNVDLVEIVYDNGAALTLRR